MITESLYIPAGVAWCGKAVATPAEAISAPTYMP
jgi:hypothetical protein